MTQIYSTQSQILEESSHLIAVLEHRSAFLPSARDALVRQRALHQELEAHQEKSEQALAAWRSALTHRWQCEIEGQRQYTLLLRQLRDYYGADSPQLQTVLPSHTTYTGSAEELLHHMQRLSAALHLLTPAPVLTESIVDLEAACTSLEHALSETQRRETERRTTSLDRRLIQDACAHAIAETSALLDLPALESRTTIDTPVYIKARKAH
jgi:hypothetical protein